MLRSYKNIYFESGIMHIFTNKEGRFNYRENEDTSKKMALEPLEETVCFM